MMRFAIFGLLLTILALAMKANALTTADYQIVRGLVLDAIDNSPEDYLGANFLRLAFHDCVSDSCDGCINMDNSDNAGLQDGIDALEAVLVQAEAAGITIGRADLWALAGQLGAEWGMTGMPGNVDYQQPWGKDAVDTADSFVSPFTFKTGRLECSTSPNSTQMDNFPTPFMTHAEVLDYFAAEFDMTPNETVAIMGAHTIGKMKEYNSGWQGAWLTGRNMTTFDNKYFSIMINPETYCLWGQVAGKGAEEPKPEYKCNWLASDINCANMLNTDFEMFFDLTLDSDGHSACEPRDCEPSSTYDVASHYANNNEDWIADFVDSYAKMTSRGYGDSLVSLEA